MSPKSQIFQINFFVTKNLPRKFFSEDFFRVKFFSYKTKSTLKINDQLLNKLNEKLSKYRKIILKKMQNYNKKYEKIIKSHANRRFFVTI